MTVSVDLPSGADRALFAWCEEHDFKLRFPVVDASGHVVATLPSGTSSLLSVRSHDARLHACHLVSCDTSIMAPSTISTMSTPSVLQAVGALVVRIGPRKAMAVLQLLMDWSLALSRSDWEPITVEDYAAEAGCSRAQAYRRVGYWKEAFDTDELPNTAMLTARANWITSHPDAEPATSALAESVLASAA